MKKSKTGRDQQSATKPATTPDADEPLNSPLTDAEWRELCYYLRQEIDAMKREPAISEAELFKGLKPIED